MGERTDRRVGRRARPGPSVGRGGHIGQLLRWAFVLLLLLLAAAPPGAAEGAGDPGALAGRVTDATGPVPFARVVLTPVADSGDPVGQDVTVSADGRGRFRFVGLRVGRVRLRAEGRAGSVPTYWPGAFTAAQAGVLSVGDHAVRADIRLGSAVTLTGRVLDARSGQPVEFADIVADVAAVPGLDAVGRSEPSRTAGGFVVTGLPPVPVAVRVRLPLGSPYLGSWFGAGPRPGPVAQLPAQRTLDIRLQRGAVLAGRVRGPGGRPVAGAQVSVDGCRSPCPTPVVTDELGRYRIVAVPPDAQLAVVARPPDTIRLRFGAQAAVTSADRFTLSPGQVVEGVDLTLPGVATVTGDVVGVRADGARATFVALQSLAEPYPRFVVRTEGSARQADGFEIGPVPAGDYQLLVRAGRRGQPYLPVRWASGTGTTDRLRLDPGAVAAVSVRLAPPSTLLGTVTSIAGWPGLELGFLAIR